MQHDADEEEPQDYDKGKEKEDDHNDKGKEKEDDLAAEVECADMMHAFLPVHYQPPILHWPIWLILSFIPQGEKT